MSPESCQLETLADKRAVRAVILSSSESVRMFSYVVSELVQYFINCRDGGMGRMLLRVQ